MLQDYSEGTGSAAAEAEKSANNWTGSTAKLSNAWTDLVSNFVSSDGIITATNLLTGLVKTVDTASESIGALGSIGAVSGLLLSKNNAGKPKCWFRYLRYS